MLKKQASKDVDISSCKNNQPASVTKFRLNNKVGELWFFFGIEFICCGLSALACKKLPLCYDDPHNSLNS